MRTNGGRGRSDGLNLVVWAMLLYLENDAVDQAHTGPILDLRRRGPLLDAEAPARRLGSARTGVNVHLSRLGHKGATPGRGSSLRPQPVVVIGGANVDLKCQITAETVLHTSNPGQVSSAPGGVARNVAENLARLGVPTHLIAAVGRDPAGERLMADTARAGVRLEAVLPVAAPTGSYTAVLDAAGELIIAIADMGATDRLTPDHLRAWTHLLTGASHLILDGNLPAETLKYALQVAAGAGVPVSLEPVSVPKAARIGALLSPARPVFCLTPNGAELEVLAGRALRSDAELRQAVRDLHARGVRQVWVRLGARGSLLSSAQDGPPAQTLIPALPAQVRDVTGAGDAMLAGFIAALLAGAEPVEAARQGHAAAALTVESPHTVCPNLSPAAIARRLQESPP